MKRRDWLKALGFGSVAAGLAGKAEAKKPIEKPEPISATEINCYYPMADGRLYSDEIIDFLSDARDREYLGTDVSWVMHSNVLRLVQILKNRNGYFIFEDPPVIIEYPGNLSEAARKRLVLAWEKLNTGKRTEQRAIVLTEGMKISCLPNKPNLLGFPVLADNSMSKEIKTDRPVMKLVRIADTNSRGD